MSERIMFLYNNQFDLATLTASSEATGFPASNLKNPFRSKVWRTAGATAGTANLIIDLGAGTKSTTCIALAGYNWAAAPGTLQLLFHDDASFGAGTHTETLTWAANPTANGNYGVIVKSFDSYDERYLKLNVVYAPGDWDLGRIFVGNYFQPAKNYLNDWGMNFIDESLGAKALGGQEHFDEIQQYREVRFSHVISSQAEWESFQAMCNSVGIHHDIFVAFDYTNEPDEMTIYGKFFELPAMQSPFRNFSRADFGFRESR